MITEQLVIKDDASAAPEDCDVIFDIGLYSPGKMWFSVENADGECTWFMSRDDWIKLKDIVERHWSGKDQKDA